MFRPKRDTRLFEESANGFSAVVRILIGRDEDLEESGNESGRDREMADKVCT